MVTFSRFWHLIAFAVHLAASPASPRTAAGHLVVPARSRNPLTFVSLDGRGSTGASQDYWLEWLFVCVFQNFCDPACCKDRRERPTRWWPERQTLIYQSGSEDGRACGDGHRDGWSKDALQLAGGRPQAEDHAPPWPHIQGSSKAHLCMWHAWTMETWIWTGGLFPGVTGQCQHPTPSLPPHKPPPFFFGGRRLGTTWTTA